MSNQRSLFENEIEQSISVFAEDAYLNYSMYVILDRALPQLGDGLKPVQRRIIYAMSDLGLSSTSKPKKAARTIGDVIGKFHPHGDSACYEAMVNMAQNFSYRYPLIDGQGNWGSQDDPKSFAAMRYTEAKMTAYTKTLLAELDEGTVDWQPNFDGTLREPKIFPAQLPNLLLNGCSGIAVGMATDIPSHNIKEVIKALKLLIKKPNSTIKSLLKIIKGPDFASGGVLVSHDEEIESVYKLGQGTLRLRGSYQLEKKDIVITELPYQISGAKLIEQIAQQMFAKKLPMVNDLRDESDHDNPCRIVISLKKGEVNIDQLISHICATTDFEKNIRVNLNVIDLEGLPRVFNLLEICLDWLKFRRGIITRRAQFRLENAEQRLHVLEGMMVAFLNIDEVIRIIRNEDDPKSKLIKKFKLTEIQANAILDLRLRNLAKLEEIKIKDEQAKLINEIKALKKLLKSKDLINETLANELDELDKEYGDDRRTKIEFAPSSEAIEEKQILSKDPVTLIVSKMGWVRLAKGHEIQPESLSFKGDDFILDCLSLGANNNDAIFLDGNGRAFSVLATQLPSARGFGDPLSSLFKLQDGVDITSGVLADENDKFLICSSSGYGFQVSAQDLITRNKSGRAVIRVPENSKTLPLRKIHKKDSLVFAISSDLRALAFSIDELPELSKGKGVKIINLPKKDGLSLLHIFVISKEEIIEVFSGKKARHFDYEKVSEFIGARGRRGLSLKFKSIDSVNIISKR
jgi:topoisomerase-4 subunit A